MKNMKLAGVKLAKAKEILADIHKKMDEIDGLLKRVSRLQAEVADLQDASDTLLNEAKAAAEEDLN